MNTTIRHHATPPVNGCRWCGIAERDHAQRWVPSRCWHVWEPPTDQQRLARMTAQPRQSRHT